MLPILTTSLAALLAWHTAPLASNEAGAETEEPTVGARTQPTVAPTAPPAAEEATADEEEPAFRYGGALRYRVERWNNIGFGGPPGVQVDDTFALWRALLHGSYDLTDDLTIFGEIKTATATDRDLPGGIRIADQDDFALEQLYLDWTIDLGEDSTLRVRPGRQWLTFGRQRLISPLPWANTFRRWDGLRLDLKADAWNVALWGAEFVPVDIDQFNEPDPGTKLFGLYASRPSEDDRGGLEAYALESLRSTRTVNGTTGDDERLTLGGRTWTRTTDATDDAEIEVAVQLGKVGDEDVRAWMAGGEIGRRFEHDWNPRGFLRFDVASGDDEAGGDVETFDQLFPLGHAFYGYADMVGRQNALDLIVGGKATPLEDVTAELSHHTFFLLDPDDALYNAGGGVLRPGGTSDSRYVGHEIDLTLSTPLAEGLVGSLGFSYVFAGEVLRDSIADENITFVYLQLGYSF